MAATGAIASLGGFPAFVGGHVRLSRRAVLIAQPSHEVRCGPRPTVLGRELVELSGHCAELAECQPIIAENGRRALCHCEYDSKEAVAAAAHAIAQCVPR